MINGKQNVKLEKGFTEIKNFNKQIPIPFKVYADFECLLRGIDCGVDNEVYADFECLLRGIDCGVDNDCFSYTKKY